MRLDTANTYIQSCYIQSENFVYIYLINLKILLQYFIYYISVGFLGGKETQMQSTNAPSQNRFRIIGNTKYVMYQVYKLDFTSSFTKYR